MLSNSTLSSHSFIIICDSNVKFEFVGVNNVYMNGLKFVGCTGNRVESVDLFTLEASSFVGQEDIEGTALELVETEASLVQSSFNYNKGDKVHYVECFDPVVVDVINVPAMAGGAILVTRSKITIIESMFEGNSVEIGGAIFSEFNSNITIINSTFVGNNASKNRYNCVFGNGGVLYDSGSTVITITDSEFIFLKNAIESSVTITNSKFIKNNAQNVGGAISLDASGSTVTITNSQFMDNSAQSGGATLLYLEPTQP